MKELIVVRALLALAAAVLLSACAAAAAGNPNLAASVGDAEIPITEVQERFEQAKANEQFAQQLEADADGAFRRDVQAQILTALIQVEILEQWAAELGVEATPEEVAAERDEVIEQLGGEEAFAEAVASNGLTDEQVDEQLAQRVLQDELATELAADDPVSDADIQAYYDENRATRFGGTATARHILVEDGQLAQDLREQLDSGADFAELAGEHSIDTGSAAQGGQLPPYSAGQTAPEFDEVLFNAPIGELVGPVQTQFGFHLIEVLERSEPQPLEAVAEEIRSELEATRGGEVLQTQLVERTKQTEVEVNPRFGRWDAETGQVRVASPLGETTEAPGAAGAAGTEQPLVVPTEVSS